MTGKTSWIEKLNNSKDLPKVVPLVGKMKQRFGAGKIVIPAPRDVDRRMKRIRTGKLTTIDMIRDSIARQHKAQVT